MPAFDGCRKVLVCGGQNVGNGDAVRMGGTDVDVPRIARVVKPHKRGGGGRGELEEVDVVEGPAEEREERMSVVDEWIVAHVEVERGARGRVV